jgi:restriction endonuclease S subunit
MFRLRDIVDIRSGASIRGKLPVDPEGNVLTVQQGDIGTSGISDQLERISYPKFDRYVLEEGDVLLRSKGSPMVAAQYKRSAFDPTPVIASASVLVLRAKPVSLPMRPEYLVWLLNSIWGQTKLQLLKTGTHIPVIAVRDLVDLEIPVPSARQQEFICELADLARSQAELAGAYREKMDALLVARAVEENIAAPGAR